MAARKKAKKKAAKKRSTARTPKKAPKRAAKKKTAKRKTARKKAVKKKTVKKKTAKKKAVKKKAVKKKAVKKKAVKKKAVKKKAAKRKKTRKKAAPRPSEITAYRDRTDKRLDGVTSQSVKLGEELFDAIDAARRRYTDEWEKLRRRHLSLQMRLWKLRPGNVGLYQQLRPGIDQELQKLESDWKDLSKEVHAAIKQLS